MTHQYRQLTPSLLPDPPEPLGFYHGILCWCSDAGVRSAVADPKRTANPDKVRRKKRQKKKKAHAPPWGTHSRQRWPPCCPMCCTIRCPFLPRARRLRRRTRSRARLRRVGCTLYGQGGACGSQHPTARTVLPVFILEVTVTRVADIERNHASTPPFTFSLYLFPFSFFLLAPLLCSLNPPIALPLLPISLTDG